MCNGGAHAHILREMTSRCWTDNQTVKTVSHSRNRTGCLTCRRRKKRCDFIRDVCGHCSRLNLVCHWQNPRDLVEELSRSRSPTSPGQDISPTISFAPDPMQFLIGDTADQNQRSLDRKLALRYYIQTFTPILTTSLENNGFLSVLMPMAIEDRPLLDMLIAWSSSHLSLCNDVYHVKALEHRSTALKSFASSLSTFSHSPELSLAGCLVFCSMSAILGDTVAWHNHLDGAARIIRSARSSSKGQGVAEISKTYEGRWLLRNFAYHDILMSVTLDREPLISGQYWISEPKATIDSYFGLASEPMALLSKISSLNGDMVRHNAQTPTSQSSKSPSPTTDQEEIQPSVLSVGSFSSRARQIETDLQNWKCDGSNDPCLVSQAEAYRSAALIHLYRVIKRHVPGVNVESKIARQTGAIIQHAVNMPLKCLPECTLLFPLFMAGGEATSKADFQFIRQRLHHIATYRHFQNAASALSVLEELWLQHTSFTGLGSAEPLDWRDILQRRGWKLALS